LDSYRWRKTQIDGALDVPFMAELAYSFSAEAVGGADAGKTFPRKSALCDVSFSG